MRVLPKKSWVPHSKTGVEETGLISTVCEFPMRARNSKGSAAVLRAMTSGAGGKKFVHNCMWYSQSRAHLQCPFIMLMVGIMILIKGE